MVVPAHAIDRVVLAGLDIQSDNKADLLFIRMTNWGRPGGLLPEYVIDGLLVREKDVAVEAFLAGGKVIGAEALIARAA